MFDKDTASTILTCILHAHTCNLAHNEEVNKLFKLNKLPPIVLPENLPSKVILSLATNNEKEEETEETEANQGNNNEEKDEVMTENDEEEEQNQNQEEQPPPLEKIRRRGIGLQIITRKSTGWPNIATTYLPPRRAYLPITDFHKIASQTYPTYIIGDLNAHHPNIDKKRSNIVGKALMKLIDNNKLKHIGPDFSTFLSHNASTTPDIVLTNNKTYHNIQIQPGPITLSDHIPILIKITSQPIKIDTPPTYIINKTNRDLFSREVQNKTRNINTDPYMNQQNLEKSLEDWIHAITETMIECIPTKTYKTIQKTIYNERVKKLQFWVKQLLENSIRTGWNYTKYITSKTIKQTIINKCIKEQNNKTGKTKLRT